MHLHCLNSGAIAKRVYEGHKRSECIMIGLILVWDSRGFTDRQLRNTNTAHTHLCSLYIHYFHLAGL